MLPMVPRGKIDMGISFVLNHGPWNTRDEINFLRRLDAPTLRQYRDTMHVRHDWGAINREEIAIWIWVRLHGKRGVQRLISYSQEG
jgi:hypothetical protein